MSNDTATASNYVPHYAVTRDNRLLADTAALNHIGRGKAVRHLGFGYFRFEWDLGDGSRTFDWDRIDFTDEGKAYQEAGFSGRCHEVKIDGVREAKGEMVAVFLALINELKRLGGEEVKLHG